MRKLAVIGVFLALEGCASEYDHSAYTSASAAQQVGIDQCNATARSEKDGNATHLMTCYMTVQGRFARAISLKRMDVFEAYRGRALLLATQVDAQEIPASEFFPRYGALKADFNTAILSQEVSDQAANAGAWNGLAAAGAGLQGAGAALQANSPAPMAPPVNCTSYALGNTVQTRCQ